MSFGIEDFKSNGLNLGGARPTTFQVEMPNFPLIGSTTGASGTILATKISLMAKAASIPASIVDSIDVGYFGRKVKVVGDRVFPDWNVTFYNDQDFTIHNVFLDWHEMLNSREPNLLSRISPVSGSSHGTTDPNNYKRDLILRHYSKGGSLSKVWTMVGAFPTAVQQIELDWDSTNQIETFNVTFAYDYWEPVEAPATTSEPTPSLTLDLGF